MASKLVRLPCVDEDGYFCDFKMVMEMPDGELLLPDDVAQIDAPAEDPAAAQSFYRLSDDKSSWIKEPKPKTAEDCVAMGAVSHQSQTQRCNELRQLFQKLTEGSTTHRIARGPDLEWIVEKIPEKTLDELKEEKAPLVTDIVERHGALGKMRSLYLRDPDGNLVEIAEYRKGGQHAYHQSG